MHGEDDDGYPVVPQPGFAPFVMMLQRHVPWADERLRGSYYQRAWQVRCASSAPAANQRMLGGQAAAGVQLTVLPPAQLGLGEPVLSRLAPPLCPPLSAAPPQRAVSLACCAACRRWQRGPLEYSMWCSPTPSRCSCRMTQATAAGRRRSAISCRWGARFELAGASCLSSPALPTLEMLAHAWLQAGS